jgi:gas vesicle protein
VLRFIFGLVAGVAIGAAATAVSQGQSGQDLRVEFERIRSDIEKRDFDALGAHLEERFKELQSSLEERFAEADEAAEDAEDAAEDAEEAADAAEEAAEEAATA